MIKDNNREFFRIEDRLLIKWRIITLEEFDELKNTVRFSPAKPTDDPLDIELFRNAQIKDKQENERIYSYLMVINKKLDMILDYLNESVDEEKYISRNTRVDISGSGISFVSDVQMTSGDYVEMKIALPMYPHLKIHTLCKVTRTKTIEKDHEKLWETAFNFLVINDKDREMLINYIFMREREMLRYKFESLG